MEKKGADPFSNYARLEEAATFFLYSAFQHIYTAAQLEVAGIIFAELIDTVEPEPDWVVPSLPSTLPELLHELAHKEVQVISDATLSKLSATWEQAQITAPSSGRKLAKTHAIKSIEVIGHIIDLAACVETVVNRHLFLLRESGKLEDHLFAGLDRAEVIPKILFAFKDEIQSKRLPTSRLVNLFKRRNQAVHFKASSTESVQPTVEELLGIWREAGQLFDIMEGTPTRQEISDLADGVASKWFG